MPGDPWPDYDRPPLVEVVYAAAFEPLPVSLVDLAGFALREFGEQFPRRQEQPPISMLHESFATPIPQLGPTLALLTGQSPTRLWLQSADQNRLIQLQRDWLACNWQKYDGGRPYPRYQGIESFFLDTWDRVATLATPTLIPTQCELSYINQILPGELGAHHGELHKVLQVAGQPSGYLPEAETGQIALRFRMPKGGPDLGRLYVQAASALRPADQTEVIQLTLIARGAPESPDRAGMVAFFRAAHEWIVRGFAAVTTEYAQTRLWDRRP